jgi:hypothetical protein
MVKIIFRAARVKRYFENCRMAGNLRILALDRARPVLVRYADPFQALLFPGLTL